MLTAQEKRENERVRAKEPTTVTVYGTPERAQKQEKQTPEKSGNKVIGAFKKAATSTWNGVVDFGGWIFNVEDDIPSGRERRGRSAADDHRN